MERWRFADPFEVVARLQEQEQRKVERSKAGRSQKAREALEALFEGDCMARRLEVPPHITAALHQWGDWANRPQFWANLNVTPFCKLMGMGQGRPLPEIKLDPQSMKIHRAFARMQCRTTKLVLIGYYVAGENWDSKEQVYRQHGISRRAFYETLRTGSVALYNAAKL